VVVVVVVVVVGVVVMVVVVLVVPPPTPLAPLGGYGWLTAKIALSCSRSTTQGGPSLDVHQETRLSPFLVQLLQHGSPSHRS